MSESARSGIARTLLFGWLALLVGAAVGLADPPRVPYSARPNQRSIVVAKAIGPEESATARNPDAAAGWRFEVSRTLAGTELAGDVFVVTSGLGSFQVGRSYVLYFRSGDRGAVLDRFADASPAAVADAVRNAKGAEPRLVLWAVYGGLAYRVSMDVRMDGSFAYQIWTDDQGPTDLKGGWRGTLTREQVAALTSRFAGASESKGPGGWDGAGGVIGWRDERGRAQEKSYAPFGDRNLWSEMERLAKANGRPIPPASRPSTRPLSERL